MSIWQNLPKNFTILAPMEGVTDVVFRQVIARASRPDLFFTEFTNVSSFASEKGRQNTIERLAIAPTDPPIIAQLWGTNVDNFTFTAQNLPEGFIGIDINMGCPEKHVVKTGGGSALIKTPDLASQLISAAKTSNLPVSVKTRLGYSRIDEWRPWLTHLLRQDISALTVHLRTKKEMSKVPAHHDLVPDIIALRDEISPSTILSFNGDFLSRTHFDQVLSDLCIKSTRKTSIGCMIGRGIFTHPFCFEKSPRTHTKEELIQLLNYHLDLFNQHHASQPNRHASFAPLKRFFKIYINNFPGASDLRTALMETNSTTEVRTILTER